MERQIGLAVWVALCVGWSWESATDLKTNFGFIRRFKVRLAALRRMFLYGLSEAEAIADLLRGLACVATVVLFRKTHVSSHYTGSHLAVDLRLVVHR